MNYYATVNKADNSVSSIMSTTQLDPEYAAKNGMVEVYAEDAAIIEKYLPTHDVIIDPVEGLMVYERVGQRIDSAKTQLTNMLSTTIESGFFHDGNIFSCSLYDQVNTYHMEHFDGFQGLNSNGEFVTIGNIVDFKKTMARHVFSLYRSHIGFKNKLVKCTTFKEIDSLLNSARIFYDGFKKNRDRIYAEFLKNKAEQVLETPAPVVIENSVVGANGGDSVDSTVPLPVKEETITPDVVQSVSSETAETVDTTISEDPGTVDVTINPTNSSDEAQPTV